MMTGEYTFTDKPLPEVSEEALEFADALFRLQEARANLDAAINRVPNYTGQHNPEDYYRDEQAEFNMAARAVYHLVKGEN